MRRFEQDQIQEAYEYASSGGQALHLFNYDGAFDSMTRIRVFLANHPWAHLIDYDLDRLRKTAKKLGVRVIVVGREGRKGQHVDLCSSPLVKALAMCDLVEDREEDPDAKERADSPEGCVGLRSKE